MRSKRREQKHSANGDRLAKALKPGAGHVRGLSQSGSAGILFHRFRGPKLVRQTDLETQKTVALTVLFARVSVPDDRFAIAVLHIRKGVVPVWLVPRFARLHRIRSWS